MLGFQSENQDSFQVWPFVPAPPGGHHRCGPSSLSKGPDSQVKGQTHQDCQWGKWLSWRTGGGDGEVGWGAQTPESVVLCARVKRGAAMLKGKGSQPVCLKQFL